MTALREAQTPHGSRTLLLEIATVVIGILIAFALDSWWDSRGEALRERALLQALRGDFTENVARLRESAERQEAIVLAGRRLLELARSGRPVASDTVRGLLGPVSIPAASSP